MMKIINKIGEESVSEGVIVKDSINGGALSQKTQHPRISGALA